MLVGSSNADDAGVYKINDEIALLLTVDFFTPIVDDPYSFGAIAAANSLSDIYAMGGKPLTALNLVAFPAEPELYPMLGEILKGGADKAKEAGIDIIGGHTIKDKEPKYGLSVVGIIHPDKILDNAKAKPNDAIILTKPIGTGIITTGIKKGLCSEDEIESITKIMAALNKEAAEVMLSIGVSTATDITGFGLIGHLFEVCTASKVKALIYKDKVPLINGVVKLAKESIAPGGTKANVKAYSQFVKWDGVHTEVYELILNDAQTSGGLLIFAKEKNADAIVKKLNDKGSVSAEIIGRTEKDDFLDLFKITIK